MLKKLSFKRKALSFGSAALGTIAVAIAPISLAAACASPFAELRERGVTPIYRINVDSWYKAQPLWEKVVENVKVKLAQKGLSKFEIVYTQQLVDGFSKDKISLLGYNDPTLPDLLKIEYGDLSAMNYSRILMPFPEKWVKALNLDPIGDKENFLKTWGGEGIAAAVLRGKADLVGNVDNSIQQVIGMPYSLSTSVMTVRNAVIAGNPNQSGVFTPENINTPEILQKLREFKFSDTTVDSTLTAAQYKNNASSDRIPASYVELAKITEQNVRDKGLGVPKPAVDTEGKYSYVEIADSKVIWSFDKDKGVYVSADRVGERKTEAEMQDGLDSIYKYVLASDIFFFTRMDLWSELGQFISLGSRNDGSLVGKRSNFLWSEGDVTEVDNWKSILEESSNEGARSAFKLMWDQYSNQIELDNGFLDPNQIDNVSFRALRSGARTFPITGIWDLPLVEDNFAAYVLGVSSRDKLNKLISASFVRENGAVKFDDDGNPIPSDSTREIIRIKNEVTGIKPLTSFKGSLGQDVTPFLQVSDIVVNNRIAENPKKWNPSVVGNDGVLYSKQDVILMLLEEFKSSNDDIMKEMVRTQQVSPISSTQREAITSDRAITEWGITENYREYFAAQTPSIPKGIGGPRLSTWYNAFQSKVQDSITKDIRIRLKSSLSDAKSQLKEQIDAGINLNPILFPDKASVDSVLGGTEMENELRFQLWYNLAISTARTGLKQVVLSQRGNVQ